MRRLGMLLLAVGLVLGLGCASKKLTLHPVVSNVYNVEGFPVVTVSDDYKLVECRNLENAVLQAAICHFWKPHVGAQGGSIYMTLTSSLVKGADAVFDTSPKDTERIVEFKGHTYVIYGTVIDEAHNKYDTSGSQETIRQERLNLLEIFDRDSEQFFTFDVDMDVLPQGPRDKAATLELMLGLLDQAIVSIEP